MITANDARIISKKNETIGMEELESCIFCAVNNGRYSVRLTKPLKKYSREKLIKNGYRIGRDAWTNDYIISWEK